MKFEVINDKGKTVYYTYETKDIPNHEDMNSMIEAGYKFKIDGKAASKKKIEELKK